MTITDTLPRFAPLHGWANRILRVDLTHGTVEAHEAAPYLPAYLGARGLAARLCWDEMPAPVAATDPANPLMLFPGALTGSPAPYAGRSVVCAFSPQGHPHPWFTRSSVGGHVGGQLKRAGYDGLVVTGASEQPVRLRIRDDEVSLLPAEELWGRDALDTLEALAAAEGRAARSLVIGPAGERLSRIATIQTASSSACGQGGFGAVMGAKRLKAITIAGSGTVSLAHPNRVAAIARGLARVHAEDGAQGPMDFYDDLDAYNRQLAADGDGRAVCRACTEGCVTPCTATLLDVPGAVHPRPWSGMWCCVGRMFLGFGEDEPAPRRRIYDWQLARRAAFELNVLSNRYGLNQFDLLVGLVPWLIDCQRAGLLAEVNGRPIDWQSPAFWDHLLHAIAYRQGLGDALAEGGWAASHTLGLGQDLARAHYPGWGYAAHCDGRDGWGITFPYWLAPALMWLADTRDPFNSGHGYLWVQEVADAAAGLDPAARAAALERLRALGERVYGSPDALDPTRGYAGKAAPAVFQMQRAVIKDCMPADAAYPLIYRASAPDGLWRLEGVDGVGDIDGPSVEYHLFAAGTGVDWTEAEFTRAAARVCTLERALQVRHWGRDRALDEAVLPYFDRPELFQSPYQERRHALDRAAFGPLVDEFYALHGWDPATGWPTQAGLEALGLGDLYAPMVAGAAAARQRVPAAR
jgi:aldehyde:ferredoxin oxidoreductase